MELQYKNKNGKLCTRRNFTDKEFEQLKSLTNWIEDESRKSIRERVHCVLNNISTYPKCPVCNNKCNFLKSGKYAKTCGKSCGTKNKETQEKITQTNIEKYGVPRFVNQEKAQKTMLSKYGVEHTSKLKENRNKAISTTNERYSKDEFNGLIKNGVINKYGVENIWQCEEIKDSISIKKAQNYQERRTVNDYKGTVYILYFPYYNAYKIGLSGNFENRAKLLKKDFGEYEIIKLIESDKCYALEKYFHELLGSYRMCLESGVGRTEFFNAECKEVLDIEL